LFYSYSCLTTPHQGLGVSSTDKDAWYYNMHHKHRGKAIILNHMNFRVKNKYLESRDGTDVDCNKLEAVLKKLGFNVTPYVDLTLDELDEKLDHCMYTICLINRFLYTI